MSDVYEKFVQWYLRFNGYFTIENFVVHEPHTTSTIYSIDQGAEFDTIGVRFPRSIERVPMPGGESRVIDDDPVLINGADYVDFVVAEVKSGSRNSLNEIWRPPPTRTKLERVEYLLRRLGPFEDEEIAETAAELQRNHVVSRREVRVRLLYFSSEHSTQAMPSSVLQVTFDHIARFIVGTRTPCWTRYGLGPRSKHNQWDSLIQEVWRIADPDNSKDQEARVAEILRFLAFLQKL